MELLDGLTRIASRAAAAILAIPREHLDERHKADRSLVTAADKASEAVLLEELRQLLPDVPIISEESTHQDTRLLTAERFLVVDPLDGTREFVAGCDEYTVNIALIEGGCPVAGVLAAPARGLVWRGQAGHGAERLALLPDVGPEAGRDRTKIHTRPRATVGMRVLLSRSHLDAASTAYVSRLIKPEKIACGSALKFGLIAEGSADLYPRLSPTSIWDVAAGHAVLAAAGGDVRTPDGASLRYGQPTFLIPGFIAFGDRSEPPITATT